MSYSQDESNIGFGGNVGYKCPNDGAGFLIEYKIKRTVDLYGGICSARFSGFGYTVGSDVFLLKNKWQPCIGIAYNYLGGNNFSEGQYNVDETNYKVNPNSFIVGIIGVRKMFLSDDKTANGFIAFTPYISYRYSSPPNTVIYESGYVDKARDEKINNRIGNGIGFGIKMLYFIKVIKANKK